MEEAAFRSPLNEQNLKDLGRLALNFGYVEFLLDAIIGHVLKIDGPVKLSLITPLTTRRKLELIEEHSDKIHVIPAAGLIKGACAVIQDLNSNRNQLLHGYWAFRANNEDKTFSPASHFSKKPSKPKLLPEQLSSIADRVAIATKDLAQAWFMLRGQDTTGMVFPINLIASEDKTPPSWLAEFL